MHYSYQSLKSRHRNERDNYHLNLSLRVHRSLSWLDRAERSGDDPDARFIFLWIAFNAAYTSEFEVNGELTEQKVFASFFKRICEYDQEGLLYKLLWSEFPNSIRLLLNNKYVFKPFWDFCSGNLSEEAWQTQFDDAKQNANRALSRKNTVLVLKLIFSRLYTLRNQILHGGATWNSKINRDQVRDGVAILSKLVPAIISIMMDNSDKLWGDPCYPVID